MERTVIIEQINDNIECLCWVVQGDYEEDVNYQHNQFNLMKIFVNNVDITGYAQRFKDIQRIDDKDLGEYLLLDGVQCPKEVFALFENDYDFNKLYEETKEMCFN